MDKKINFQNAIKYIILFIILFIIVSIWFMSGISQTLDTSIYSFLYNIRNDNLTKIMLMVSNLAFVEVVIIISMFFLIVPIKKRRYGLDIGLITVSQYIFNSFIKVIFKRPRMEDLILVFEKSYSFPSGHTMTATVMYGFLIYLICKHTENKIVKAVVITVSTSLILLVAFSRVYLGAHYFSDVLAALFLGISFLIVAIVLTEEIRIKLKRF